MDLPIRRQPSPVLRRSPEARPKTGSGAAGTDASGGDPDSSKSSKSGQSSTESQKPAGSQDTGTSTGSGETQKSGDVKSSSGSTETQSNSKTKVENNNTSVDSNTENTTKTETSNTTNVNISVEQQTEIRSVVKEVHVEPVREADFTVSVGTTIPKKIRLEPLPPRIVEIVPQYKAYRFFLLADGRIVIVDPSAFTIVYIISA